MARWNGVEPYNAGRSALAFGPHVTIAVLALTAAIPGFAIVWLMSAPLLLPSLSLAALVNAGCVALLAWFLRAKRHTDHVNLWDIAGAYAFIGFASGMISKPEHVLQLFGLAASVQ
jgi:hypothetical protein